jgi:hypothetical protein
VRLADGTKVTFSTLLGAAGQVPLHLGAYLNTGSLHGWSTITSGTGNWDGTPGFFKAMQRRESTTRSYKSGVPLHTLTLIGGTWTKPTAAALLLGVTDSGAAVGANNARIEFTEGGISTSHLAVAGKYTVPLRIKAPASAFVLPPVASNPGKLALAFSTLLTGEITGTFITTDANPNGGRRAAHRLLLRCDSPAFEPWPRPLQPCQAARRLRGESTENGDYRRADGALGLAVRSCHDRRMGAAPSK